MCFHSHRAKETLSAAAKSDVAPTETCLRLFEKGIVVGVSDSGGGGDGKDVDRDNELEISVKTVDGRVKTFNRERDTCPWDAQHDSNSLPDDVTQVNGFGEGALLTVIRRRFLEDYKIYTYVSDILIVVNPYMFIAENVVIQEPAKQYQVSHQSVFSVACICKWLQ